MARLVQVVDGGRPRCLWGVREYFARCLGARGSARRRLCGATLMSWRLAASSCGCGGRQRRGVKIVVYSEGVGVLWPLLSFSWVFPGQNVKGDGQAGNVLEVAEAIRRARLVTGVTGDVLRQTGKEASEDVVFAQVRLGAEAGAEVSLGVVSFCDLHVEAWMQLLHGYMEGVDRAIEGPKNKLDDLQEGSEVRIVTGDRVEAGEAGQDPAEPL
ncbi:hypothetical protein ACSSS7_001396 [Eimeria intestinalis]